MAKKIVLVLFVLAGLGISGGATYSTQDRWVTRSDFSHWQA
jgi:hypothetical protein